MSIKQKLSQAVAAFDQVAMSTLPGAWPLVKKAATIRVKAIAANPLIDAYAPLRETHERGDYISNKAFLFSLPLVKKMSEPHLDSAAEFLARYVGGASVFTHALTVAVGGSLFVGIDVAAKFGIMDFVGSVAQMGTGAIIFNEHVFTRLPSVIKHADVILSHAPFVANTVIGISIIGVSAYMKAMQKHNAVSIYFENEDKISSEIYDLLNMPILSPKQAERLDKLEEIYEKHYEATFTASEVATVRSAIDSRRNLSDLIAGLPVKKQEDIRGVMDVLTKTYRVPGDKVMETAFEFVLNSNGNAKLAKVKLEAHKIDANLAVRLGISERLVGRELPKLAWH